MASNPGPSQPKQIPQETGISYGHTFRHSRLPQQRGLYGFSRYGRRLFPHPYTPQASQISSLHGGWRPLPVQGPAIRAKISPQNLYKMPSSSGCNSMISGNPNISVLGRLADKRSFRTVCPDRDHHFSSSLQVSGTNHQRRQMSLTAKAGSPFPRSHPGHNSMQDILVSRSSDPPSEISSTDFKKKVSFGLHVRFLAGNVFINNSSHSASETQNETSSGRVTPSVEAGTGVFRRHPQG